MPPFLHTVRRCTAAAVPWRKQSHEEVGGWGEDRIIEQGSACGELLLTRCRSNWSWKGITVRNLCPLLADVVCFEPLLAVLSLCPVFPQSRLSLCACMCEFDHLQSFTMFGPDISTPSDRGIIPRACNHIFRHISEDQDGTEYTIKCSFLEIYKELVNDLLVRKKNETFSLPRSPSHFLPSPASFLLYHCSPHLSLLVLAHRSSLQNPRKRGLKVRETPSRGVWVDGLTEEYVTCEQDVYDLIKLGEKSRAVASTNMNATSSRSHSLFILKLHQKSTDGSTKEGKLNLADLAGARL